MFYLALVYFIISYITFGVNGSVESYISISDNEKFLSILSKSLSGPNSDIAGIYYGVTGYNLLDKLVDPKVIKSSCDFLSETFKGNEDAEIHFYAIQAWSKLKCTGKIHKEGSLKYLENVITQPQSSVADIRYAIESLKTLGAALPSAPKIAQVIQTKLKEDDSLVNLGHALHISVHLEKNGKFISDRIEDIVVQLDEVNGKLLQWEGGLTTTSLLLTGILNIKGVTPFTQTQADKIANYLLSRKTVQTSKGIVALMEAVRILTSSSVSPISISVIGKPVVTINDPNLKIRVTDLIGRPIKPAPKPIIAVSATRVVDDVVVLSKEPLVEGSGPSQFILPIRLEPDRYKIVISVGSHTANLNVRVLGDINLSSFEIGLHDVDSTTAPLLTTFKYPNKLQKTLQADSGHLLVVKFVLSRFVQQAFLRFYSEKNEIIFIAEQGNDKVYKIEVNINAEFSHSGLFEMELILGDSVMSNPIKWNLGKIEFNLGKVDKTEIKNIKKPKDEIKHIFRLPEKRPSNTVSLLFAILTASPILLLFILWAKIGLNVKNFSAISIPFHFGFGSILCLFISFWIKLDMFTTCACLIPLGIFTFLSGHKILSKMASNRKV